MGRVIEYRQRIRSEAASIERKGLLEYLASYIKARREISLDEAILVARDTLAYLNTQVLLKPLGQLELPAIAGRDNHLKRPRRDQEEKLINLTVVADDDVELMRDFGIHCMQNGRLARIIEEAYYQDAILDGPRLQLLFLLNHKSLRNRLKHFWDAGCILPVAGMTKAHREKMQRLRPVIAIERYLQGEELGSIQRDLAISDTTWKKWWRSFRQTVALLGQDPAEISKQIGEPEVLIEQWQALWNEMQDVPSAKRRLEAEQLWDWERPEVGRHNFGQTLIQRHGFSPAATAEFIDEIHDLIWRLEKEIREPGQIGYIAVSADEPPGRSLAEADLVFCKLEYLAPSDWEVADRDNVQNLKWERLKRLATQAYQQGAALTQPDLAFMLGIGVDGVRSCIKAHDNVVLPTRGQVADMGPTISHAEKVIRLYMDGYTETEIVRRTGHSYESIERYLLDFARVICLLEKGMPVSAIRTVMGSSRRVVERYVKLYEEYAHSPDGWRLGQLRRMGQAHPVKKTNMRGRWRCGKTTEGTGVFPPEMCSQC